MPPSIVDQAPLAANDQQRWSDRLTLELIEEHLNQSLHTLDEHEQRRYLLLARLGPQRRQRLSDALHQFRSAFEHQALDDLRQQLALASGQALDPLSTYLHTYSLEVQHEFPHQEVEHLQTRSLWQAAQDNFGFNVALQSGSGQVLLRASSINTRESGGRHSLIPVSTFVDVVRNLNLGKRLQDDLQQKLPALSAQAVNDYQRALLQFALLEAYRSTEDHEFNREQLASLQTACERPGALQWKYFSLKLPDGVIEHLLGLAGSQPLFRPLKQALDSLASRRMSQTLVGNLIPLPFFVVKLGDGVFSYFPERPGGAWRSHASAVDAVDSLRQQIHQGQSTSALHWLYQWLPLALQQKLSALLKPDNVDRNQLNALAKWLYDTFANQPSTALLDVVENPNSPWKAQSLLQVIAQEQQHGIAADLALMAISNNSVDFDTFQRGALFVVSEVLELLTLSVPGGVTGLNRAMLTATFASLGFQSISAANALLSGRTSEAVQAAADIADLIISARLQGLGARLSARRSRHLVAALGRAPAIEARIAQQLDSRNWSDARLLEHLQPQLPTKAATSILRLSGVTREQLEAAWSAGADLPWQLRCVIEGQPSANAEGNPAIAALTLRFPDLSVAAAHEALRRHPQLMRLATDSLIEPGPIATVLGLAQESRSLLALCKLDDERAGPDRDAEALCCQLLAIRPEWPATLGIRIEENLQAPPGTGFTPAAPTQHFGSADATDYLSLTRTGSHYHFQDMPGVGLLQALHEHPHTPLAKDDSVAMLREQLLDIALRNRDLLPELLAEPPLQAVSAGRLRVSAHPLAGTAGTPGSGIHRYQGTTYAMIEDAAYPIVPDASASTPEWRVWRLADGPPADSPAIVLYRQHWYYARVPGAAGMPRRGGRLAQMQEQNRAAAAAERAAQFQQQHNTRQQLLEVNQALLTTADQMTQVTARVNAAVSGSDAQQQAISALVVTYWKTIKHISTKVDLLETLGDPQTLSQQREMHEYRLHCLEKIMLSQDLAFTSETGELLADPHQGEHGRYRLQHRRILQHLEEKRPFLDKHAAYIKALTNSFPGARTDAYLARAKEHFPATALMHQAAVILFKMDLLVISDTPDPQALIQLNTEAALRLVQLHDALSTYTDLDSLPEHYQLSLLDDLQRQFDNHQQGLKSMQDTAAMLDKAHLRDIDQALVSLVQQIQQRLESMYQDLTSNTLLSLDSQALDTDFLPARSLQQPVAGPRKRVIKVRQQGATAFKVGEAHTDEQGREVVDIINPGIVSGPRVQRYVNPVAGYWQPLATERQVGGAASLATQLSQANTLLGNVEQQLDSARQDAEKKQNPSNIVEALERHAGALEVLAQGIESSSTEAEQRSLLDRLHGAAQRLRQHGEALRLMLYKSPETLDINRLLYLIEHRQVSVHKTLMRAPRGKGRNKHFLDIYQVRDAQGSRSTLWEAHFHYDATTTALDQFQLKGAHLKTLAQSRLGAVSQAQAEREGQAHEPIWRAAFSPQAARELFRAASDG
ncbi:hypothetical protein [Pseudomonas sp. SBB6]|uniref:hypothetical protein n=1 Tax=Pseudomonas sp. SBB6 TaxID=2962032 RepID=UPI0020B75C30|nr:hypothetical protein [Pseudomonas sp. SBB6]MCP3750292.1 hypothetical protein [Pseudomonas sp. SBB6]